MMREVRSPSGILYFVHDRPEDLSTLSQRVVAERRIWLDTEIADWNTPNPRLSLIQLRLGNGSIHVVDVLADGMRAAYEQMFVPMVVSSPAIEKWAHYARFERRVFGDSVTQGLKCTFELARGVPYHRLPLRSLSLAALVCHLWDTKLDKSLQKADWGRRPLSSEELDYAAWDPEWCYRVHQKLEMLVRSWEPGTDDSASIQSDYLAILPALRDTKQWRSTIWDAVKAFMVSAGRERFQDFLLQIRVIRSLPIRVLEAAVAEADPTRTVEFSIPIPSSLIECLRPGEENAVRAVGHEMPGTRFTGPRAPRTHDKPTYTVDPGDPEKVCADFAAADHQHRMKESERQELKDRMRAWMQHSNVLKWGDFAISESAPKLTADVRVVAERLADGAAPSTGLPSRFLLAFSPEQLEALGEHVDAKQLPVMRWRPDRRSMPIEIAQSRDWHGSDDDP